MEGRVDKSSRLLTTSICVFRQLGSSGRWHAGGLPLRVEFLADWREGAPGVNDWANHQRSDDLENEFAPRLSWGMQAWLGGSQWQ